MEKFLIYLVDDDQLFCRVMYHILSSNKDYEVETFYTAKSFLDRMEERQPNVVCLDFTLPDKDGFELTNEVKSKYPEIPIIVISGQENLETAVELMKAGIYNYLTKDKDTKNKIWFDLRNIRNSSILRDEYDQLRKRLEIQKQTKNIIIGSNPQVKIVNDLIYKACVSNIPVSIEGETGVGKKLIARTIHDNSQRNEKPFVVVSITSIPPENMEEVLFGVEYPGEDESKNKIGKFQEAEEGTIVLDEITAMTPTAQAKLSRTIHSEKFSKVGSNKTIKMNTRIIVTSKTSLDKAVEDGVLRPDLYYRLLGLHIYVPPLRERREDIPIFSRYFLDLFCEKNQYEKYSLTQDAIEKLSNYNYPGNVSELKAIIELAAVLGKNNTITEDDIKYPKGKEIVEFINDSFTLEDYTHYIISNYLKRYGNKVNVVAEKLNVGKSTIYRFIKEGKVSLDKN
ncbi:MAG: sigma-54 dependent transcriptional regulator [Bacteroidales bacterium]